MAKSILQSYVEKNGTKGLNKSYVDKALANGGGYGATAVIPVRKSTAKSSQQSQDDIAPIGTTTKNNNNRKSVAQSILSNKGTPNLNINAFGAGDYGTPGFNAGKAIQHTVQKGAALIAQAGSSAFAFGEDLANDWVRFFYDEKVADKFTEKNQLFHKWNENIKADVAAVDAAAKENLAAGGKVAQIGYDVGSAAIAALPQLGVAMATGGGSVAAQGLGAANTGAQALATATVKNPQYWTSFFSMVGGEYEQALANGASETKATLQAMASSLVNAAIEIGGGIQTLPTELQGSKRAIRAWIDSMVDEGKEEVVQGIISRAMEKLIQQTDNPAFSLTDENAVVSLPTAAKEFGMGAAVGGILGGVPVITGLGEGNAQTTPTAPKTTENDQKVIDKLLEDSIAEAEKDGKKLTNKEKEKLRDKVMESVERGEVSFDTIAEVLDKESYDAYKKLTAEEEKAVAELAELYEGEELQQEVAKFLEGAESKSVRSELDKKVFDMVKDGKLAESYLERSRRSQAYQADVTQYDEKQQATVQNAINSGVLNDTRRTHEFVDLIAKISADKGIAFDFTNNEKLKGSMFAVEGKTVNGYVTDGGITLNIDSAKSLNSLVGHEITHVLEGTNLYGDLQNILFEYAKSRKSSDGKFDSEYKERLYNARQLYKDVEGYQGVQGFEKIKREVVADLVGDYLFTDADFVNNLVKHKNLFQMIWDEIKYLCNIAKSGSKEEDLLLDVKRAFEKAYRDNGKASDEGTVFDAIVGSKKATEDGGTKYSIGEIVDESGKSYGIGVHLDSTLLDNLTPKERVEMVKERVKELGGEVFTAYDNSGNAVDISIAKPEKKFKNRSGKRVPVNKNLTTKYIDNETKQESVVLVDELIVTAKFDESKSPSYPHGWLDNDGQNDWDYWITYIQDKNNTIWEAILNVANTADGEKVLYDIGPIKKVGRSVKSDAIPTKDNVPQSGGDVKYSFKDSDVKVMDGGSVTKYSLSTWTPETQTKVRNNLVKAGYEEERVDKWIKDTNSVASVIAADKDRLDFEAADNQTMLKNNQEYVKTLDASTLCAKRLVYQGTFDAIQHRMPNTVLSSDDLIKLANMMKEHGVEAPCAVCYVESRRRHLGKFAQEWLDNYDGEYKPNLDEVTTSDGLEALRKSHPTAYEDFMTAMKKKGSANPKVVELRTEYRNEIMALTPVQVKKIEAIGGLRVQSFSDFETPHLLDMMQAVMDMSAKGLTSQAYTKVPNFAWVFGDTGIKINLSLIAEGDGFDSDGNLSFSSVEGMDIAEAMSLRDTYSQNVGTIIVGANDKHILACMADDRIDFIIPFHRSGWGQKEIEMMGMTAYEDYTYGQKEHDLTTGKGVENLYPPDYWDYNLSGKENAERYLNLCAKTNREPKFSHFLVNNGDGSYSLQPDGSTDGYWKTLIDFKMYDNEGNGAPQQKVQPNFNMEEAYRVLEEYEGGANKLPVANDVVEEFVAKHRSGKLSLSAQNAEYPVYGDYNVYGEDVAIAPVADIAPVAEDTASVASNAPAADIAPVAETPAKEVSAKAASVQEKAERSIARIDRMLEYDKAELETEYKKNRALLADRNAYISNKASELYDEIRNLKKGVRASALLGELLDSGYEWSSIRAALTNIKYTPGQTVNVNSAAEARAREVLNEDYENSVYNLDEDYAARVKQLEDEAAKKRKSSTVAYQRKKKQQQYYDQMAELAGDTSTWVDKKLGISYRTNTLKRNLRDIVRDAKGNQDIAKADAIYNELQGKYNTHEAMLNRESTQIKKPYADMKITKAEDEYIQMLGEFRHNPDTTLTEDVVKEFYEKHKKDIDTAKVDKAIEMARQTYDELLIRVNEVLREQGMKEIPYRKGYFPHFTDEKQRFLAKLLNWKVRNNDIPTDIAGLTENFNPNRSWQSFNKQRKSDITDYSFTRGMDTYVQGALDWIYHIEDIQKRRAFENYIRYVHSEKGVQEKIDAIKKSDEYDADEAQEQIDLVYKEAGNPLNNFVTDLRAGTNTLANKKSSLDRTVEELTSRKFYSVMTNVSNRVSANMVAGSVSSALTNFIPITQSWGTVSPISSAKAMWDTMRSTFRDDGMVEKSDFLTNRLRKAENLYKTGWDKVSDKVGLMMEAVDSFTSQTVWRSKYLENINNGMSESEAIANADQFAESVMAGRSRGNMPTIFDSKNPLVKIFTAFQLEVGNQYGYMLKDMPQDMKNESTGKLIAGYAKTFIGAYAYNALYSMLTGRDAALDPIGIIEELLKDLGVFGDDEEEEEKMDAVWNLIENIGQEIPFVGGLLGGGRIPLASALPYSGDFDQFKQGVGKLIEGDFSDLTSEWLKPIYYMALPMGGGQIKKSVQGLQMFSDDHPVAGSYTKSGNLRFPVEDTIGNRIKAGIFGQYANKNAREYFDNNLSPLKEKQIQEYIDSGMDIDEYREYRKTLATKKTVPQKLAYIDSLDLPISKKNILANNAVDRKTPINMADY